MGFYGNMTNTAHTQFQFDRIYPNRSAMDASIATDGIYIGRYVLVEYDQDGNKYLKNAYAVTAGSNLVFYTDVNLENRIQFNKYVAVSDDVVTSENFKNYYVKVGKFHNPAHDYDINLQYYELQTGDAHYGAEEDEIFVGRSVNGLYTGKYYKCTGEDSSHFATFIELEDETESNFLTNYTVDVSQYGMRNVKGAYSRAWDSTVWQKVYSEGENKYIMIAELNSGAPAVSVSFDRPSQTPLPPHVGGMTGDNVYDIHLQQPWGFRVAAAAEGIPSDDQTAWIYTDYDESTDSLNDRVEVKNADIYFNKAGFDIEESIHDEKINNSISIRPTGKSGTIYANHKGYVAVFGTVQPNVTYYTYNTETSSYEELEDLIVGENLPDEAYVLPVETPNDINEMSIHLPAIGNAIADVYDFMYGVNPETGLRTRNTNWLWVGQYGEDHGGRSKDIHTLAGTINTAHDALGMIIQTPGEGGEHYTDAEIQRLPNNRIYYYFDNGTYYYKSKEYEFDPIDYTFTKVNTSTEEYIYNCYYKLPKNTTLTAALQEKFLSLDEEDIATYRDIGGTGFNSNYDYYKRTISLDYFNPYEAEVVDFEPGKYYYKEDNNYYLENLTTFSKFRDYYKLDPPAPDCRYQQTTDEAPIINKRYYTYNDGDYVQIDQAEINEASNWQELGLGTGSNYVTGIFENLAVNLLESYQSNQYYYYTPGGIGWSYTTTPYNNKNLLQNRTEINPNPKYTITLDTQYPQTDGRTYYRLIRNTIDYKNLFIPDIYFWCENDDGMVDPIAENTAAFQAWLEAHPGAVDFSEYQAPYVFHSAAESDMYSPVEDRFYWRADNFSTSAQSVTYDIFGNPVAVNFTFTNLVRVHNLQAWDGLFIDENYNDVGNGRTYVHPTPLFYYKEQNSEVYTAITSSARFLQLVRANIAAEGRGEEIPYPFYNFVENGKFEADELYQHSVYYYFDEDNNIILDTEQFKTNDRDYYKFIKGEDGILTILDPVKMYESNVYYYHVNGNTYQLDSGLQVDPNKDYYYQVILRVSTDLFNHYSIGSAWNSNIKLVPCHIELGISRIHYILRPLFGFLKNDSTMYGLILALSQMLEKNNIMTRENDSLQGIINNCVDLNAKFDGNIQPNKIMITDNYGKITTCDVSIQSILDRLHAIDGQ